MKYLEVLAKYDDEAEVWYIAESDIPGLAGEAATLDELWEVVQDIAGELIEANMPDRDMSVSDMPVHLMSKSLSRIRVGGH